MVIPLGRQLPVGSSGLPRSDAGLAKSLPGPDQPSSFTWPCSRWGLPSQSVARLLVRSYRTFSPLPDPAGRSPRAIGGVLSVALSLASRPVGVTHHRVLWSPDFPLPDSVPGVCLLARILTRPSGERPSGQLPEDYTQLPCRDPPGAANAARFSVSGAKLVRCGDGHCWHHVHSEQRPGRSDYASLLLAADFASPAAFLGGTREFIAYRNCLGCCQGFAW